MRTELHSEKGFARRVFLRSALLLGVGGGLFGLGRNALGSSGDFVVINGWVLPAKYFRQGSA